MNRRHGSFMLQPDAMSTTGYSPTSDPADLFALAAAVCDLDLLMAHRDRPEWQDTRRRSAPVPSPAISLRPDTPSVGAGEHLKIT